MSLLRKACLTGMVCALGLAVGCREANPRDTAVDSAPGQPVRVAVATRQPTDRVVTALGSFAARSESLISAKVEGRLAAINVDLGSAARAGDVLATIEARDYELEWQQADAALRQARAGLGLPAEGDDESIEVTETTAVKEAGAMLEEATANRDRVIRLSDQGIVSQSELDAVDIAYRVAKNRYDAALEEVRRRQAMVAQRRIEVAIAQERLSATEIRAPFDGVVQERHTHPGEFLRTGDPVVTLLAIDPLRLRLEISEREASRVRAGQRVTVRVSESDRRHEGILKRVSPALTQRDRVLRVEADVPNKEGLLHAGSFARAEIVVEEDVETLMVPTEAVRTFAGVEKVFVVEKGQAEEIQVQTGMRRDGWVEIVLGLEEGEQVVLNPGRLRNGERVQVTERSPE